MTELPTRGLRSAAAEMARIASGPYGAEQRARTLLATLRETVPFDFAAVSLCAPDGHGLHPLAWLGHRAQDRRTGRTRDLDVPLIRADSSPIGLLTLAAPGCRDAVAAGDLLDLMAPVIGYAVDPMRPAMALVSTLADIRAGVALTGTGEVLPLPGLPGHPLLAAGSAEIKVAAGRLDAAHGPSSFLSASAGPDGDRVKINSLACHGEPPYDLAGVVVLSPARDVCGLTCRELEILGLMVDGCSNQRIAGALYITERTAAAHVANILAKLGVPSRTLAAVRALRMGLYVPPVLLGVHTAAETDLAACA